MNRRHAAVIALFLAVALVAGMFAALQTTQLGASSAAPKVSAAQIAQRNRQLDAIQAKLRRQAAQKPPALPAAPASPGAPAASSAPAARSQRVIYVRPAPIVKVVHRAHGDDGRHESEHDGDGGGSDD